MHGYGGWVVRTWLLILIPFLLVNWQCVVSVVVGYSGCARGREIDGGGGWPPTTWWDEEKIHIRTASEFVEVQLEDRG